MTPNWYKGKGYYLRIESGFEFLPKKTQRHLKFEGELLKEHEDIYWIDDILAQFWITKSEENGRY